MSGGGSNAGFSGEPRRHLAPEFLSRDQPRIIPFGVLSIARDVTAMVVGSGACSAARIQEVSATLSDYGLSIIPSRLNASTSFTFLNTEKTKDRLFFP
jgi:hypothetical protein